MLPMDGGKAKMRRQAISLGRILGIPIGLDYSWFLIFALLTWTLAVGYFPSEFNNWPTAEYWIVGGVTAVMLFVSVLLHELGHSVLAMLSGFLVYWPLFPIAKMKRIRKTHHQPLICFLSLILVPPQGLEPCSSG